MTYTTEQLLEALENELSLHLKGDRTFFSATTHHENVSASIDSYWNIRDQIHAYQAQHSVSGLVIESVELPNGGLIKIPVQHDQLDLVDGDMDVLKAAKDRVVATFLDQITASPFYLCQTIESRDKGKWDMETTPEFIRYFSGDMDWAELSWYDEGTFSLKIGYGEPAEADYVGGRNCENWYFNAQRFCRNLKVE